MKKNNPLVTNTEDQSNLKKKIWMLIGVTDVFSLLPKIGKLEEVQKSKNLAKIAKELFNEGNFEEAASKATSANDSLLTNCKLLPKRGRAAIESQLKKIASY